MLLLFFAFKEYFNYDIMILMMNHPKFSITTEQLYLMLFHLCIDDNKKSIKIILNNDNCAIYMTKAQICKIMNNYLKLVQEGRML